VNVFYLEWNSFGNEDMYEAFEELGHRVVKIPFAEKKLSEEEITKRLKEALAICSCDFVFSFNYFPQASIVCNKIGLRYVSWVYDSPHIQVYSYTVINPCNYVFLFDYAVYQELYNAGIQTVYYLPLAVNEKRLGSLVVSEAQREKYKGDISFVGSLYNEKKHRIYDKFQNIDPYARGYLDGMIRCQQQIQGYYFLQEMLTDELVAEMEKAYPTNPDDSHVLSPRAIYADYVLARQVTALERRELLETLGSKYAVHLYTYESDLQIPGVENRGKIDYYDEMPYVFRCSKINLNITLRSIKTGIPLRALDIMGSGGFLLSNYQQELLEYFVPGEDFVFYESTEDLMAKAEYYLTHDKERREIAQNGCKKVCSEHNMKARIAEIIKVLGDFSGK